MIPGNIIRKKRDGQKLTKKEINWFVRSHVAGKDVEDYHAAAFTMAVFFNGMHPDETAALTDALMHSGEVVDPKVFKGFAADKHSTGGVGDTVSLILAPLVASFGVKVPMVSGRGLGHTGGTLDKLESIPGFRTDLTLKAFIKQTNSLGCCMIGQTETMCPGDKKWYALRDVTATVESIPLIVASIMSKKMAEGIGGLVLDVKVGSGAFMKTMEDAQILAKAMVETGKKMGRKVRAVITDMSQPLARCAGNALEAKEAIRILRGEIDGPLKELTIELSAHMLVLAGKYKRLEGARTACERNLTNGKALAKFRKMVKAQFGNPDVCDDLDILPKAKISKTLKAKKSGYIAAIDTMGLGLAANVLGAGRSRVDDVIDPAVGLKFHVSIGDKISANNPLVTILANDNTKLNAAKQILNGCFSIIDKKIESPELIKKVIE